MVRTPSVDKNGLKKGAWSPEEDTKLQAYISRHGHGNWRELPKFAGLQRCGKSCRLRWMNYLRPNIRHGGYTDEEEDLIMELHQKHGNKWSMIAGKLPGRTDNEIKNHWHTHLKKRCGTMSSDSHSSSPESDTSTQRHLASNSSRGSRTSTTGQSQVVADIECLRNIPILESSSLSSAPTVCVDVPGAGGGADDDVDMSDGFLFGSEFTHLDDLFDLTAINYCPTNTDFWTTPFTVEEMTLPYDVTLESPGIHQQLLYETNLHFFSY